MNKIIRATGIVVAPGLALSIGFFTTCAVFERVSMNPIQDDVTTAVQEHMSRHKDVRVPVFHDSVFVATREIAEGEKLKADSLEQAGCDRDNLDPEKIVQFEKMQVVGATVKNAIHKGDLISDSHLFTGATVEKPEDADYEVKEDLLSGLGNWATIALLLFGLAAWTATFASSFWIAGLAFTTSVPWGLGVLLVPFVASVYEVKFFDKVKKAFVLQVVSLLALGVCAAYGFSSNQKTEKFNGLLEKSQDCVYTTHDIVQGAQLTADDLTLRAVPLEKCPVDAFHENAEVLGRTAKYGLQSGRIVSRVDVSK